MLSRRLAPAVGERVSGQCRECPTRAWPAAGRTRGWMRPWAKWGPRCGPGGSCRRRRRRSCSSWRRRRGSVSTRKCSGEGGRWRARGAARAVRAADPAPSPRRLLLDLLRMNVAPLAVFQMLKSLCAGQRPAPSGPAETGPETRGRNKTNSSVSGTQGLAERCSREGSVQRMPRQPSTSRLQKTGTSGKSSGGSST
uniref:Mitotic spindle organizing protein 2B n=1 Tax=Terrapene triunguis TaxID=2587831 RepID=A0A674JBJ6_9SAUR